MPQKLIRVRPTKIELIRLRRRLTLATRIQKLIKDRLSIVMLEFLQIARETVEARNGMLDEFARAYKAMSLASGFHGYMALEKDLQSSERELELISGMRNVAGVRIVAFELRQAEASTKRYSLIDTSATVDKAEQAFRNCLHSIVTLAELQSSLELLGKEINRTKRIVNALDYLIIPSLQDTIKFLYMKFEERDREEKSRLKRVKSILERKGS